MTMFLKAIAITSTFVASAATNASGQSTQSQAQANFMKADANSDTALTIDEFTRFIDLNAEAQIGNARIIQRTGQYARAFKRVDANGDGLANAQELSTAAGN